MLTLHELDLKLKQGMFLTGYVLLFCLSGSKCYGCWLAVKATDVDTTLMILTGSHFYWYWLENSTDVDWQLRLLSLDYMKWQKHLYTRTFIFDQQCKYK